MFSELREAGGPIDTIGNDAAQLVVNVDDAFQLVGGLGEDPAARTCSLRKEKSRGAHERRDCRERATRCETTENNHVTVVLRGGGLFLFVGIWNHPTVRAATSCTKLKLVDYLI